MKILSGETDIAEYDYDALGRRVRCINYYDPYGEGNATTTDYYYSNNWQVLEERNEDGDLKNWYTYGNYIDELLMKSTAATGTGSCKMYLHDHLYSPVRLIDTGGNTYECYEYDAYGEPIIHISWGDDYTWLTADDAIESYSAYGNKYLFTGREVDFLNEGNFKLQYNRNRYYDYYTGRWLTQDPIGYVNGMNLYEYVKSNSLFSFDPLGTELCGWKTDPEHRQELLREYKTSSFEYGEGTKARPFLYSYQVDFMAASDAAIFAAGILAKLDEPYDNHNNKDTIDYHCCDKWKCYYGFERKDSDAGNREYLKDLVRRCDRDIGHQDSLGSVAGANIYYKIWDLIYDVELLSKAKIKINVDCFRKCDKDHCICTKFIKFMLPKYKHYEKNQSYYYVKGHSAMTKWVLHGSYWWATDPVDGPTP